MLNKNNKSKLVNLLFISFSATLIAICSWIYIPFIVPFTLQTFAIFFILSFEGAKKGLISILIYLFLGFIGLPVFSGFKGGISTLFGVTGGYIIGFIFIALIYMLYKFLFKKKNNKYLEILSLFIGLIVCYTFGTLWFVKVYTSQGSAISFLGALSICVLPFIIPDIAKLVIGYLLAKKIKITATSIVMTTTFSIWIITSIYCNYIV